MVEASLGAFCSGGKCSIKNGRPRLCQKTPTDRVFSIRHQHRLPGHDMQPFSVVVARLHPHQFDFQFSAQRAGSFAECIQGD